MSNLRIMPLLFLLLFSTLMLSGCLNKQTAAEELFDKLEEVVEIEKTFEAQQEPLVELERKEKEIYQSIIELNLQEHDEVVRLAGEAISITEQRKEHIDKERTSMQESKDKFESVPDLINKIDEKELRNQATELYDLMQERYRIHEELYNSYSEGLKYDTELYNLFKNEEITIDELGEQINKVNGAYEKVMQSNEQFNEVTEKYNEKKLKFYKEAGLNIQTDTDE